MSSSLSKVTGSSISLSPAGGGGAASFVDQAVGAVYTGEVGLVFSGILAALFLWVLLSARASRSSRRASGRSTPRNGKGAGKVDLPALRRARMTGDKPNLDDFS